MEQMREAIVERNGDCRVVRFARHETADGANFHERRGKLRQGMCGSHPLQFMATLVWRAGTYVGPLKKPVTKRRRLWFLTTLARLKPEGAQPQAQAEMTIVAAADEPTDSGFVMSVQLEIHEVPLASASGTGALLSAAFAQVLKTSFSDKHSLKLFGKELFVTLG